MCAVNQSESYWSSSHRSSAPLLRRRRRPLEFFLFLATLAVFAYVNAFWQYLSTGHWINYSPEAIRRDLAVPLGRMLLAPLSIFNYPWMTLVAGFILAVVIFAPLLVAVLHRLRLALLFVMTVAVLGHAPVLAGALLVGCVLASRTPLRSDTPFLAVLLGLVPVGVYLYLFGVSLLSEAAVLPLQRGVAAAPFMIALLSALLVCGLVLVVAKLAGYRQLAVWPMIVLMMSGPTTVFHLGVGTDELRYSLITGPLAPGDSIFSPDSLANLRKKKDLEGLDGERLFNAVSGLLDTRRAELIESCRRFVAGYPDSERAPAVLWIAAQCHSLRISRPALDDGRIMYYASHLSAASEAAWRRLIQDYRKSRQAALAHWSLGRLTLRQAGARGLDDKTVSQRLAQAGEHLAAAEERLAAIAGPADQGGLDEFSDRVFLPVPLLPTRGCYRQALLEVRRLRWLISANDVIETWEQALSGGKPADRAKSLKLLAALSEYLQIDARGVTVDEYRRLLGQLLRDKGFEKTRLGDNITVAWACVLPRPSQRASALIAIAKVRPPTDAAIPASFELGVLASGAGSAGDLKSVKDLRKPQEYFKLVIAAPDNPWKPLARERLAWLAALDKGAGL